jgi:hypothetical protein
MSLSTRLQVLAMAGLLVTPFPASGEGVILTKANANQDAKYWRAVGFQKVDQYVASIKARLLDGKEIVLDNSSIGEIIEIPNWSMMNASNEAQLALLTQQRDDYKKKAAQYPQIEKWVQSIVSRYDVILSSKRAGYILAGGRWMDPAKVMEINGKAYTGVSVEAVKNGWVLLKHDGGTTSMHISELSSTVLTQLKAAYPSLFTAEAMASSQPPAAKSDSGGSNGVTVQAPPKTFKEACERHRAVATDWDQVVTGNFQFETGKAYRLGPLAKSILPNAVLGTLDTEITHYVLVPQEGEKFKNLPAMSLPGVPLGFEAVGVYEKSVHLTSGQNVPLFRCLFLSSTSNGAVMYDAKPQNGAAPVLPRGNASEQLPKKPVYPPEVEVALKAAHEKLVGIWTYTGQQMKIPNPAGGVTYQWVKWVLRDDGTCDTYSSEPTQASWGEPHAGKYEVYSGKYTDTGERYYGLKIDGVMIPEAAKSLVPFLSGLSKGNGILQKSGTLRYVTSISEWKDKIFLKKGDVNPFTP